MWVQYYVEIRQPKVSPTLRQGLLLSLTLYTRLVGLQASRDLCSCLAFTMGAWGLQSPVTGYPLWRSEPRAADL